MKKSTLFFKVMVLLALLVPWTSWGQSQLPEGIDENDVIAQRTMVLDENGDIPDENSETGKNIKLSDFDFKSGYTSDDWDFVNPIIVLPENSGVSVDYKGTLKLDGHPNEGVDAIYIKIENDNGEVKWARYGFVAEGTIVIEDLQIAYPDGKEGSKVYDGEAIDENDIKTELTVSATVNGENKVFTDSEYTITIPDNAVDANETGYSFTVKIIADGYVGEGTGTYKITKRPITIVVKEGADLEYEVGDVAPTEFKAEDYLTVTNGTDTKSGLVSSETPTFIGNLTVTGFSTEKEGTFTIEQGSADITDNASSGFKKDNYNPIWSLTDAEITVKKKTIDPDDVTGTDSDGKTIVGSTESYEVTYDGMEHGVATVKIGETILDSKDYTVEYDELDTKPKDVKITEDENDEVVAYTVTIRLNEEKYEVKDGKSITGSIKILQRDLTVKGKDNVTIQWNGNTMVTTASTYLDFEAEDWVSGEGGTLTGNVKIEKNAEGDGYIITKGENTGITWNEGTTDTNYKVDWSALTSGISAGGSPTEGDDITLDPGAEGEEDVILSNSETTKEYNGCAYTVSKVADVDINKDNATLTILKEGAEPGDNIVIKDVGTYTITVDYTKEGTRYTSTRIFKITPAPLTITVGEQTVQITSMDNLNKEGLSSAEGFVSTITEDANVSVTGLKGSDAVSFDGNSFTLAEKEWVLGENAEAIKLAQDVTVTTGDPENYDVKVEAGTLNVIFLINEDNKDQFISFTNGDNERVYDGSGLTDSDVKLNIEEAEYTVAFSAKETDGDNVEYADAGTYTVTVTITNLDKLPYELAEGVDLTAEYTITKRPLILYFSFEEGIEKGEELVLGENASVEVAPTDNTNNLGFAEGEKAEFDALLGTEITAEFHLGDEQANGTYEVILDSFTFPVEEVDDDDLTYDNYNVTLLVGHLDADGTGEDKGEVELPDSGSEEEDENGDITYTPGDEDEDVVGVIDPVDPNTGIGGSGTNYRQYELNFCETDFFTDLNDYDAEGLKLFSRHNKKYTKADGSFTVWYEKDGVKNAEYGDYRIYISRNGAKGNYTEVKLDEVSDYFQIRNVQSNIYVRIYYGTGFPVANEEITATDARAYAQANKIVVITPEPTDVQIISMAGAVVATDQVTGQREFANLAEGVYIVRMGETVIKLQVRN